ncbi:hypothetical protein PITC_083690 [Penicillium italicum]|uniref:Uncharacterized protein n=1 Tax=Penicillium italicum TaxID=40296 RepID=A0A0A2LDQ7_PENIT|nr:hypothetical protein PITC_083690 [Penicillium italicum]
MPSISSFVFFVLLAAMAAYWHTDLFQLVGNIVVVFTVSVAGLCCFSGPRFWLLRLLQSVAALADEPTHDNHHAEAAEAAEADAEKKRLRAQVGALEQQLRGTEARVRDSEVAREIEKKRHEKEVRHLDSRLATVSRGIKESLLAKDRVIVECRQWRRKFEDLEYLQQQAQENPVRGIQGRPRWAPAKKNGVGKGGRDRPAKKFTAIAQVAIVNAAWESKLVKFESEARDYVARTNDQIRSLHDAATALSNDNACLQQQIQVTTGISHELAQQQVSDAVRSTMLLADHKHEERVYELKQTFHKELMAVKADYEERLAKITTAIQAKETAFAQQREAAEQVAKASTQEIDSLKGGLAAKETQLGELQASNAQIAGDLRAKEEKAAQLDEGLRKEAAKVVELGQENDGYKEAGKRLQENYEKLQSENETLAEEVEDLEEKLLEQDATCHELAESAEKWRSKSKGYKAKSLELGQELATIQTEDINLAIEGMGFDAE